MMPARPVRHVYRRTDIGQCEISAERDAIAAIYHLTGDLPDPGSLVVVGVQSRHPVLITVIAPEHLRSLSGQLRDHLRSENVDGVELIGIGEPTVAGAAVRSCADQLAASGVRIAHALCCTADRHWTVHDTGTSEPAQYTLGDTAFDACVRRLSDKLEHALDPVTGDSATAMRTATAAAGRALDLLSGLAAWSHRAAVKLFFQILKECRDHYAHGWRLAMKDAALLCAMLDDFRMRELAVALSRDSDSEPVIAIWSDLTRLAPPRHRSLAATLLGFAALGTRDRLLCTVALKIAHAAEPDKDLLPEVDRMALEGLTPGRSARSLENTARDLAEATIARFLLEPVHSLARATADCREFMAYADEETPSGPQLWWKGDLLMSNGTDMLPPARALETDDLRGRVHHPAPPFRIDIDDALLAYLRRASEQGGDQLTLVLYGDSEFLMTAPHR